MPSQCLRCPDHLRETLAWMAEDLDQSRLEVTLVPAPDQRHCGHMVRVVAGHNPGWYRDLLSLFPRSRRDRAHRFTDSTLNRRDVLAVIHRLLTSHTRSIVAGHLLAFAQDIHTQLHEVAA